MMTDKIFYHHNHIFVSVRNDVAKCSYIFVAIFLFNLSSVHISNRINFLWIMSSLMRTRLTAWRIISRSATELLRRYGDVSKYFCAVLNFDIEKLIMLRCYHVACFPIKKLTAPVAVSLTCVVMPEYKIYWMFSVVVLTHCHVVTECINNWFESLKSGSSFYNISVFNDVISCKLWYNFLKQLEFYSFFL